MALKVVAKRLIIPTSNRATAQDRERAVLTIRGGSVIVLRQSQVLSRVFVVERDLTTNTQVKELLDHIGPRRSLLCGSLDTDGDVLLAQFSYPRPTDPRVIIPQGEIVDIRVEEVPET